MNKHSTIIQSTASAKPSTKPKNNLRGSYGKLTLDPAKFDFKSLVPSTTAPSTHPYSPAAALAEKYSLGPHKAKSPRTNQNSLGISIENFDPTETYTIDKRVHPQTTKAAIRSSYLAHAGERAKKPSNSNEKIPVSRGKELKTSMPSYEAFVQKKQLHQKEEAKGSSILDRRDSKVKIMEEPPKKFSMPTNMPSSLNTVYATGSNSHRAPLNSIPADQVNTNNRPFVYVPLNRRNSQKSNVDSETAAQLQEPASVGGKPFYSQHPLNNYLTELSATTQEHMKRVTKTTMNNIDSAAQHFLVGAEKINSPKGGNNYNDIVKLVSDKNKEIHALSQDKAKLQTTLDILSDEVQNYKKMKNALREKEKIIENLQTSLSEAIKESNDLKKGLQKDSIHSHEENAHHEQGHNENRRAKANASISEVDGIKALIGQLKALTDGSEEPYDSLELKNTLLEAIARKAKAKKPEASYALFGLENKQDKGAQLTEQANNTIDLYQRNFSGTFEEGFGKKINESPYYDALKNVPKRGEKVTFAGKKGTAGTKKLSPDARAAKVGGGGAVGKEKDSLLGTPRKADVETEKVKKQARMQVGGSEIDILKRKFSHEPRMISEGVNDLFAKKQSGMEAGSTLAYTAEKEPVGENLDIGKVLGDMKNRIAKLLNKHKDDHKKLKMVYELYADKLEKLSKE